MSTRGSITAGLLLGLLTASGLCSTQSADREGFPALTFPKEGRWSVATAWENDWPSGWRHAGAESVEEVGEWTIYEGRLELPDGILLLRDAERELFPGLRELRRRWTWTGDHPLDQATLSIRIRWEASAARPFLPGISYYDNPAGQSVDPTRIPVIGNQPGDKGFYEEHRFPMPLAGAEGKIDGKVFAAALHTLPSPIAGGHRPDQWWSLGMERISAERVELAVYSGPVASNGENGIVKGRQKGFVPYPGAWCALRPGQVVEKTVYLQDPEPAFPGSGFEAMVRASIRLFPDRSVDGFASYGGILALKMRDSVNRFREGQSFAGIDAFPGQERPWIDLGWAGQSEAVAYPMIVLGETFKISRAREIAQKSMDFISTSPFTEEGFSIRYDYGKQAWTGRRNPLSQGQAMNNMFNALRAARKAGGYDTSRWESFLRQACSYHAERILDPVWHPVSTNEAFLIAPLVQGAELLDNPRFLDAARKAGGHYLERHLCMEEPYWGGTLDARCEDKEGAWAALQGFLALYEATGGEQYLHGASHAAGVVLSYMYVWDVSLPPGRLADHAFRTRGWTAVSVQNMHLDVYGVLCAPAIWRLGELTDRGELKKLARLMSVSCGQLTDPWGSAGEQIHQTNYAQHYEVDPGQLQRVRGDYIENWNVYWITAHFLTAAAQFQEMGVDCLAW